MDTNQIEDVLNVSSILSRHGQEDAAHTPSLIADLIDWADGRETRTLDAAAGLDLPLKKEPKTKAAKATESDDSDSRVTPDPSSEPDF